MAGLEGMRLGNCQILRRIGGGGMGDIYLAEQPGLGRQVAVKVVRGEGSVSGPDSFNQQATQQFLQEARAIAALEHPNILPLYDYGEQEGIHYLVMPYVAQGSLADLIEGRSAPDLRIALPAPPAITAEIIAQAAAALQYAHDRGIIHRDVKPQNLLVRWLSSGPISGDISAEATQPTATLLPSASPSLTPPPEQLHVLLADFGLARFMSALIGRTGTAGTPLYNAPEQYSGYPVPATDQYALACVAYLLLTGRPVFEGSLIELHHRHLTDTPSGATRYNPHLPPAADTVLLRALAKDPADRYPTIREFASALRAAINPLGQSRLTPWPRPRPLGDVHLVSQPSQGEPDPAADTRPSLELPAIQAVGTQSTPGGQPPSEAPMANRPGTEPVPLMGQPTPSLSTPPVSASLPPIGMPAPNSQRLSAPPPAQTPSGSWSIHADAHPTQLPPIARQRGRVYDILHGQIPGGKRAMIIALVVIVLLASFGSVALAVSLSHRTMNTLITFTSAHGLKEVSSTISRAGTINFANLTPVVGSNQQIKAVVATRIDPANASETHIPTLPAIQSPAGPSNGPVAPGNQRFGGISQTDVGASSPMSVSAQANNQVLMQTVDGLLQIVPLANPVLGQNYALKDIFAPVLHPGYQLGEGRVFFDAVSQRWVIITTELSLTPNALIIHSYFDIAVSQATSVASPWNVYQIEANVPGAVSCTWADNLQFGNDDTLYVLSGRLWSCGANSAFQGDAIWVLPKDALLHGGTASVYRWTGFQNEKQRPIFTLTPAQEQPGSSVEWLIANNNGYIDGRSASPSLFLWALVQAPQAAPANSMSIVTASITLPVAYANAPQAQQPQTSTPAAKTDARITSAILRSDHLYAAFTTAVNWLHDTQTRTGAYWVDLQVKVQVLANDATNATINASLAQSGIAGFSGGYAFNPAITADTLGNIMLVANLSAASLYPSLAFVSLKSAAVNKGTQKPPFHFLARGVKAYTAGQWGDYTSAAYSFTTNQFWLGGAFTDQSAAAWNSAVWQLQAS